MGSIKDEANNFTSKSNVRNISELKEISTDLAVFSEENAEFPYKYLDVNSERYKLPDSVLAALQAILKSNPNLKKFKVSKSGTGLNTKYVVIPLG